jgi:hypothetical protein
MKTLLQPKFLGRMGFLLLIDGEWEGHNDASLLTRSITGSNNDGIPGAIH